MVTRDNQGHRLPASPIGNDAITGPRSNPDCIARAIGEGIVTTADAEKIFAPKPELATVADWMAVMFEMGRLQSSMERFLRAYNSVKGIATPEQLARALGIKQEIQSSADLERLFLGEPH